VAPLLLLPFVENCFKHGTSHVLDQPWVHLTISINKLELTMKLMNSKAAEKPAGHQAGIGIANAKKRLMLLYPEKHQLTITEEEDVFIVLLKLTLEENSRIMMGKHLPEQIALTN
jgi:LytS/YehU family sensor histidine kinase